MSNTKTVMGQASNQYVTPLDITEVFSTYLFNSSASVSPVTITNGIDLSGEGGMVWVKSRDDASGNGWPHITDTERGVGKRLITSSSGASNDSAASQVVNQFNADGFRYSDGNGTAYNYASWTFRKAPKFFDVVQWDGDGVYGRNIPHSLDGPVGSIFIKCTTAAFDWRVWHRSLAQGADDGQMLVLNSTAAQVAAQVYAASSTNFTLTNNATVNGSGRSYVAYVFAHNDGDGEFGPDADQDIIKCGTYTAASNGVEINLGFEPQWVMFKRADSTGGWKIIDVMRGFTVSDNPASLEPNTSDAEGGVGKYRITNTGFRWNSDQYDTGDYIYMAIRRGPLAQPESGTEVFAVGLRSGSGSDANTSSNILTDASIIMRRDSSTEYNLAGTRLQGLNNLFPESTSAEGAGAIDGWDTMAGLIVNGANGAVNTGSLVDYSWKRAPGFCDVVAYTGDGVAGRTVSHNLGVAPEMMWVKRRESTGVWGTYHSGVDATSPEDFYLKVESTDGRVNDARFWNDTAPDDTVFTLGTHSQVNFSGGDYIAYLFATLPGVSKVGSFTHSNGSNTTVDCGFTSGARFVLVKQTDLADGWFVFDTERGITVSDSPRLFLNSTASEVGSSYIEPASSGFIIKNGFWSAGDYIFYAIA